MNHSVSLILTGLIWMNSMLATAQQITLDQMQEKARTNYPAIARYDLIEKTKNFSI